tara:strand:- start:1102 stop:1608 length:507 start_codon:yes stop_codon:yes gene_type:complete
MEKLSSLSILFVLFFSGQALGQKLAPNLITDNDHKCSVVFPSVPQEVFKRTDEGMKFTTHVTVEQNTYMMKVLEINKLPSASRGAKILEDWATKMKGKVVSQNEWSLGSSKGLKGEIAVNVPDMPEMVVYCNVIFKGETEYQTIVVAPKVVLNAVRKDAFLNSFSFLN